MPSFFSPIRIYNLFWQHFRNNLTCQYVSYSVNTSRVYISCYFQINEMHFFIFSIFIFSMYVYVSRYLYIFCVKTRVSVSFQRFLIYILVPWLIVVLYFLDHAYFHIFILRKTFNCRPRTDFLYSDSYYIIYYSGSHSDDAACIEKMSV